MLLEQENQILPEPLFLDRKQRSFLREDVLKAAFRFPRQFNRLLYRSFEQMVVNTPTDFLANRSPSHLRRILCVQFFLQRGIESALSISQQKQLFLRLFRGPSRTCVALAFSSSFVFQKEQLLKNLDAFLPGISEIPRSFYLWHSPDLPYGFCYFEIHKLRGKELSTKELRVTEKMLKEQMLASPPLTTAVFWPYNKEESHRQVQLLVREMRARTDLPHISIQFQEQTASSLDFLIQLVRPKPAHPLPLEKLPESLSFFRYSKHLLHSPFPIEIDTFSIKVPSQLFVAQDTINLLYARRYIVKHLETMIGPFRDFNGGLFEKQQDHFEMIRFHLGSKIPYFDLFAEKLFYALHPFEKWFALSLEEVENLFTIFAQLIQRKNTPTTITAGKFAVVKTEKKLDLLRFIQDKIDTNGLTSYAHITIGNFHYECFSGEMVKQIDTLLRQPTSSERALRLIFQEGSPPSLNPHYSSSDMRSRLLNKMLFEGLTRFNEEGIPELAGAADLQISNEGSTYTFHLRKAYWSNGEKVTAFDYINTWKWALQDSLSHPELLFSIKNARLYREKKCSFEEVGIHVPHLDTLQIELEEPDPQFLSKLAQPFFFPLFGMQREPKWFNGPYLVQDIKKNGIKLTRNPYYWRSEEKTFDEIEIEWMHDIDTIYSLYKEGKVDWIGDPVTILSLEQIRDLEKENRLRCKEVKRRFSLFFNTKHPILSSAAIRQALNLAIDRTYICNEIFPHSVPIAPLSYSKELATSFFEEGLRELGLTRARFPTLTFSYSDQTRRDLLGAYFQKVWYEVLGIEVELKRSKWNPFRCQLEKGEFEICLTIQDTVEENLLNQLERFEGGSSWNFSQWSHLVYRELLTAAKKETDSLKQQQLKAQAENILAENVPFAPLFKYVHLYAVHPRFQCSHIDAEGCVDFSQGKKVK